jgi:hypothetical protein
LAGDTATYPGVLAGTDLTATATATGFELSLVVKSRPQTSLPAAVTMPLRGSGLVWSLSPAGVLAGADATGKVVVTSAGAQAFDSSRDEHTGQPERSVPLALSLSGAAGAQRLTVGIPAALLQDPGTVFPVTIDPSASWSTARWDGSYDQADRLTNTGYAYDNLRRTLSVPAADAIGLGSHASTTGNLTLGYYANDFAATQTQAGRSLGFSLDPTQSRVLDTTDTAGPTSTNHYTDNGDSPAWTSTTTGWTRNITGIAGGLAATIDQAGTVTLQLANLHGDLVATSPDDPGAIGPVGYSESTEYGAPRNPATAPDSYAWLGTNNAPPTTSPA